MLTNQTKTILRKLSQKKYRKEMLAFVIEGKKGVEEALNHAEILMLVIDGTRREEPGISELVDKAEADGILVEYAGRKDIDEIKTTETFPGILAVAETVDTSLEDILESNTILILDRVSDPGNLGTIIRTADWFGVTSIILSEESVDPYNEKVARSTMGSIFRTQIFQSQGIVRTVDRLKKEGYTVSAFDLEGKDIHTAKKAKKQVLLFGSESHGLTPELKALVDTSYVIPGGGETESLNLAISVGISLYQLSS
jgi:TrmH family RNA methyltransferase